MKHTVLEYCYKDDALGDPLVNDYHIYAMGIATKEELDLIAEYSFKINKLLSDYLKDLNIELIDYKIEFGKTPDGTIILADEISPDTCRFWDSNTGEKLDKDRFRRDLGNVEGCITEIHEAPVGRSNQTEETDWQGPGNTGPAHSSGEEVSKTKFMRNAAFLASMTKKAGVMWRQTPTMRYSLCSTGDRRAAALRSTTAG